MSDFEHDTPANLELSAEYLDELAKELAGVLITHGKIEDNPGVWPSDSGRRPRSYTYPLDSRFTRETFFPEGGDIIITQADASYADPHKLETPETSPDPSDWQDIAGVFVGIQGRLDNPSLPPAGQIEVEASIKIGWDADQPAKGTYRLNYYQNGTRVSPNNLSPQELEEMTEDDIARFFNDHEALTHPLTFDDGEGLKKVIDYIAMRPKID